MAPQVRSLEQSEVRQAAVFRVPTAVKNIGCGWYGSKDVKILTPNTGVF